MEIGLVLEMLAACFDLLSGWDSDAGKEQPRDSDEGD